MFLRKLYNPNILREDFIKILNISITAKIKSLDDSTGNLRHCLVNMPKFASMIDYQIDWDKLYLIFKDFLIRSLINFEFE